MSLKKLDAILNSDLKLGRKKDNQAFKTALKSPFSQEMIVIYLYSDTKPCQM